MDAAHQPATDLADHLAALRRGWRLVLALSGLGVLLAVAVTVLLPRTYQATTAVLVLPIDSQDANAVGGRTDANINLDTEAQLVRSTAVAERAAGLLHSHAAPNALAASATVAVPPNSTVLQITYAAGDPGAARAGSHAFAAAYLTNRQDAADTANSATLRQLNGQIGAVTKRLESTTAAIGELPTGSSQRAFLDTQRRSLANQLNDLTNRRTEAANDNASAGRIISDALLPTAPTNPSVPVNLGAGGLLGLLAGLVAALGWARLGRRVRYADDLPRYVGVPVLAELPRPPEAILAAGTDGGRIVSRLRNELAAGAADNAVIVVTGTAGGPAATVVAANLAAAFARSGADTVLVLAAGPARRHPISGPALARVPARPGWAEALTSGQQESGRLEPGRQEPGRPESDWPEPGWSEAGRSEAARSEAGGSESGGSESGRPESGRPGSGRPGSGRLGESLHVAAGVSGLRVLPGTGGPVPAEPARAVLAALRERAARVIVAAPDTTGGADAQTLASLADAAILAVEVGATTRAQVRDAMDQLAGVDTPLLGAVALPAYPETPARVDPINVDRVNVVNVDAVNVDDIDDVDSINVDKIDDVDAVNVESADVVADAQPDPDAGADGARAGHAEAEAAASGSRP